MSEENDFDGIIVDLSNYSLSQISADSALGAEVARLNDPRWNSEVAVTGFNSFIKAAS